MMPKLGDDGWMPIKAYFESIGMGYDQYCQPWFAAISGYGISWQDIGVLKFSKEFKKNGQFIIQVYDDDDKILHLQYNFTDKIVTLRWAQSIP